MKKIRRSTLQTCSIRSVSIALSVSLAANAPLAALADAGPPVPPAIGDHNYGPTSNLGASPADFMTIAAPGDAVEGQHTYRIAADSAPPAALAQNAPVAQPPNASAASEKAAQENMFWDSAQRSNSVADYKAYLDAFPNGLYAPLARNRIAAMSAQPEAAPPAPPAPNQPAPPPAGQPAPSPAALKAEVGTMATEQSLNLAPDDRIELQQRLQALGLYSGPIDGNLGPSFRTAIGTWQKQHELAPTGLLGPLQLEALKAESDAAAQPPNGGPAPGAPPASGGPAAVANPDKAAQESKFWDSAERSNSAADYQAYLEAYPNGLYAQMARNRIASLNSGPQPGPGPGPGQGPGAPSAFGPPLPPVSPEALKAEVGTVETEQALDIGPPGRMELQQRLSALGLYSGPIDGDLGPMARAAIAEWQKRHDVAPTGELGPLQLAALRIESEGAFQQFLATRPVVGPPVYAPVRRVYHPYQAAPSNNAAPAVLGVLGGLAIGILGAKLGGKFGGGGKGGKGGGKGGKRKEK
ncbi:MAG: peptidoglycan-binding domain-containing protein [Roseiarcus sp.]|jgi:peptidoglycan hydrolase-like protein with peptidoglycan-binding domain